jgi:nitrite reductase (NADH) small subunit
LRFADDIDRADPIASYVEQKEAGDLGQWVRLCALTEAPSEGNVQEASAREQMFCLARVGGELRVLDNRCPHRDGPLGQGWIEGHAVVCPWHAWAFDCRTGIAEAPEKSQVRVFGVRVLDGDVLVEVP